MVIHKEISSFSVRRPIMTVGIFDGVHLGHRYLIDTLKERARQLKGESVVFTLWPHPRLVLNQEGPYIKLLNTLEEKKMLLERAGLDHLIIMPFTNELSQLSSGDFIREILVEKCGISHLVIGFNHRFGRDREGDLKKLRDYARQYDFGIEQTKAYQTTSGHISSTGIRESLLRGEIGQANSMLGWEYGFSGHVVGGSKLGSTIGFPTANITLDENFKLLPSDGVYAVKADIQGSWYRGMMNMGSRPTVNKNPATKTIEVHLFDFNKNIYNDKIRISYVARLRDEKKFKDINALQRQLGEDQKQALRIFDRRAEDIGE